MCGGFRWFVCMHERVTSDKCTN
uniref:Uncharacterized protein n=1 Tax=Anguilla anguilla TaxID=7936 RepID=A0A0E9UAK5_ANGAN